VITPQAAHGKHGLAEQPEVAAHVELLLIGLSAVEVDAIDARARMYRVARKRWINARIDRQVAAETIHGVLQIAEARIVALAAAPTPASGWGRLDARAKRHSVSPISYADSRAGRSRIQPRCA
jgi:hypothetical protein